jgi:K+/H+ antiporter YhaU regulatory subunit KhtT
LLFFALLLGTGTLFWRQLIRLNSRLELLFMESFAEDARSLEHNRRSAVLEEISQKYPWEVDVCDYTLEENSPAIGRRIVDLRLRETTGATVIALGRAGRQVFDPGPETPLFPGDHLILLGGKSETREACHCLDTLQPDEATPALATSFETRSILIEAASPLDGDTLAGANIRRNFGVTIIGIQRGSHRITTPPGDFMLRAADVLLTVGPPIPLDNFEKGPCQAAP